jgi:enamine deaminase RidA (YjgF/YER057c/UK114 family)
MLVVAQQVLAEEPRLRRIAPDEASRTSAAVVVEGATPLAHTAQILPLDADGKIVGPGRADEQAEAVLDRLELALREAGTGLGRLVKVHASAARPEAIVAFEAAFARRLAGKAGPAIARVVGALAHPEALLAVDAVAATSTTPRGGEVTRITSAALAGQRTGGHVAILPGGGRVHVSGQAEPADDLAHATRRTLESLGRTLDHLGLDRSRVVQLKAFLSPIASADLVEREVATFFGAGTVPPLVLVEWRSNLPIEIELIAGSGPHPGGEAVEYLTPTGLKPSPIFSRVARVNRGDLIYVSGLYGPSGASGAGQVEAIFGALGKILDEAGGDFRHLAKATYYVSDDDASRALNELRPRYYDPARPPAASKAAVPGVGASGRTVTLDMIAVSKP